MPGRRLWALAFVICTVLPAPALANHAGPLAAQWHLDTDFSTGETTEGTGDSSGHQLTAEAPIIVLGGGGRFGNHLSSVHTGAVRPASNSLLRPQRLTLLAWVRNSGSPGTLRYIAGQGTEPGCSGGPSYAMYTGVSASDGLLFFINPTVGPLAVAPKAGTALWNGLWHMVAGVWDGSRVRLYVDGLQVGAGTPAPGAVIDYSFLDSQFFFGSYPSVCPGGDFPGGIDELRVYNRALTSTELRRLATATGPNPPALVPDSSSPPAPRVTGIRAVGRFETGHAAVLTAGVTGQATRFAWDIVGDSRPEVTSSAGMRSVRFRPPPGPFEVEVRPIGPGGTGPGFTRRFVGPPAPSGGIDGLIQSGVSKLPAVFAAGPEDTLLGSAKPLNGPIAEQLCQLLAPTVLRSKDRALEIKGCLRPVTSLGDVPPAERGVLERMGKTLKLGSSSHSSRNAHASLSLVGWAITLAQLANVIKLTDGYVGQGSITVNGVELDPAAAAKVVAFPQANVVASSDAILKAGRISLRNPPSFAIDTKGQGMVSLGSFGRAANAIPGLGGFPLVGDVSVTLNSLGEAIVKPNLQMPDFLKLAGVNFPAQVEMRATTDRGLILDSLKIGPLNADIGALSIEDFKLDYTGAASEWRGQARACVAASACLNMIPDAGSVVVRNGELDYAAATLEFPPPGIPLFTGVNLNYIQFGIGQNPTRLSGGAGVTALQIYDIRGKAILAFPSPSVPFVLREGEIGGFPQPFYNVPRPQTTVGISANAALIVPWIGRVPLASGYFLYEYPGYVGFGGGVSQEFLGIFSMSGRVGGEFNAASKPPRFNIGGQVDACIHILPAPFDDLCKGVAGVISSRGMAVCAGLLLTDVGVGIIFSPFSVTPYIAGCKWSPYAEFNVRGSGAVMAQAGNPLAIRIHKGDPTRSIRLDGAGGAPRVQVTGPGGFSLQSTPALTARGGVGILRSDKLKTTMVTFKNPSPGSYRIEAVAGSPRVTKSSQATALPSAKVSARVRGRGARRLLSYRIRRRQAQRVTFVEVTRGGAGRTIGTVKGGGVGKLRFSPAPGSGTRSIVAEFELNGVPAEKLVVARFKPLSARLAKPGRLRVRRRGTRLRVSWRRVRGATRYEILVATSRGGHRLIKTRKRKAVLKRIPKSTSGRVTVRAVARLRAGKPVSRRFRRTARRRTRFNALPRCRTGKKKLVCKTKR